eukprot:159982_1
MAQMKKATGHMAKTDVDFNTRFLAIEKDIKKVDDETEAAENQVHELNEEVYSLSVKAVQVHEQAMRQKVELIKLMTEAEAHTREIQRYLHLQAKVRKLAQNKALALADGMDLMIQCFQDLEKTMGRKDHLVYQLRELQVTKVSEQEKLADLCSKVEGVVLNQERDAWQRYFGPNGHTCDGSESSFIDDDEDEGDEKGPPILTAFQDPIDPPRAPQMMKKQVGGMRRQIRKDAIARPHRVAPPQRVAPSQ